MNFIQEIKSLFDKEIHDTILSIERLPRSASYREYIRIIGHHRNLIGTFNPNKQENMAFLYMSEFFRFKGLNVPFIYAKDIEKNIYIQQDLGNQTLLDYISQHPEDKILLLKKALEYLIRFQTINTSDFEWDVCYPARQFDRSVYMFDLNYFKYMVLKSLKVHYNDVQLEREFDRLVDMLLDTDHNFFVYRDFQSRNIMYKSSELYFIDYQGGRRGSLFYDLVSILYDTKLQLTEEEQNELKDFYYTRTLDLHKMSRQDFEKYVAVFALVRKLQALAAYVFRGLIENKIIFLTGIDSAFKHVFSIIENQFIKEKFKLLHDYIKEAYNNLPIKQIKVNTQIEINSFSYILGSYPGNDQGNGGGFVFDCRLLPNPGRLEQFKQKNGLDKEVSSWLDAQSDFEEFIVSAFRMIYHAIINYNDKGYTHLQVNFGCTGGRHRSVYCAEKMAWLIRQFVETKVTVKHRQRHTWTE